MPADSRSAPVGAALCTGGAHPTRRASTTEVQRGHAEGGGQPPLSGVAVSARLTSRSRAGLDPIIRKGGPPPHASRPLRVADAMTPPGSAWTRTAPARSWPRIGPRPTLAIP